MRGSVHRNWQKREEEEEDDGAAAKIFLFLTASSAISLPLQNRAGGIRTHDLLNPIQAHYQAVLRPVMSRTIH